MDGCNLGNALVPCPCVIHSPVLCYKGRPTGETCFLSFSSCVSSRCISPQQLLLLSSFAFQSFFSNWPIPHATTPAQDAHPPVNIHFHSSTLTLSLTLTGSCELCRLITVNEDCMFVYHCAPTGRRTRYQSAYFIYIVLALITFDGGSASTFLLTRIARSQRLQTQSCVESLPKFNLNSISIHFHFQSILPFVELSTKKKYERKINELRLTRSYLMK